MQTKSAFSNFGRLGSFGKLRVRTGSGDSTGEEAKGCDNGDFDRGTAYTQGTRSQPMTGAPDYPERIFIIFGHIQAGRHAVSQKKFNEACRWFTRAIRECGRETNTAYSELKVQAAGLRTQVEQTIERRKLKARVGKIGPEGEELSYTL